MTPRSGALRRRRKRSVALRLRIVWVFIALIAIGMGSAIYALVRLPALRVQAIDVRINGLNVNKREVLAAAAIIPNSNAWLLNPTAIEKRIEAIPYVDAARLSRTLPANIGIDVTEREPAACVRSGARLITIDAARRVLQTGCARSSVVQIVLHDAPLGSPGQVAFPPALAALLDDCAALRAATIRIRSIGQDRFGQLVATQPNGIRLLFGDDADVGQKAKLVPPILAAPHPGKTLRTIDLRAPSTPVVEYQ